VNVLQVLSSLNATLARRSRSRTYVYKLLIGGFSLFLAAYWWGLFFGLEASVKTSQTTYFAIASTIGGFVLLTLDLFFVTNRFSSATLLEPRHLYLFPVSPASMLGHTLLSLLVDAKGMLYIASAVPIVAYFLLEGNLQGAAACMAAHGALFLLVNTWALVVYVLGGDALQRKRLSITSVLPLLSLVFGGLVLTDNYIVLGQIPIAASFADAMVESISGVSGSMIDDLAILAAILGVGTGALWILRHRVLRLRQ
jgi:hypothetical protein